MTFIPSKNILHSSEREYFLRSKRMLRMQPLAQHEQRPGFDPQQCLQKILQQWSQNRNIKAFQGGDDAKWEHAQRLPLF